MPLLWSEAYPEAARGSLQDFGIGCKSHSEPLDSLQACGPHWAGRSVPETGSRLLCQAGGLSCILGEDRLTFPVQHRPA
jgi:hypothetical protein